MPSARPFAVTVALLLLGFAAAPARAGEIQPFTLEAFQQAQAAGQPILVDAHAGWCPICWAQSPTINKMATDPAFEKLVIFKLKYDSQREEKRLLNIRQQSTLIAFAGKAETGRSTGVTNAGEIRALAATALPR